MQAVHIDSIRHYLLDIVSCEFVSLGNAFRNELVQSVGASSEDGVLMHAIVVMIGSDSVVGTHDIACLRIDNLQPMEMGHKTTPIMVSVRSIFYIVA